MKLPKESTYIEGTEALGSQHFGIRDRDMHIILNMLRSKLYKDPIKAVCREYMCNARDAHREANAPTRPIEVTLPTALSRQLEIKDYGPGISPRRMADIFLNYGASTKRRDNKQTGGFGIGGKSALALGDQFSIVSVYNGVKRHYNALIDDSKMGRMDLVHEEETSAHTGTTIIVPINSEDCLHCARAVIEASQYWDVKPIIKNLPSNIEYQKVPEIQLSGNSWQLFKPEKPAHTYLRSNKYDHTTIVIDGIGYDVTNFDLKINDIEDELEYFRVTAFLSKPFLIHFKAGELSLVPSRDNILFDTRTIEKIRAKIRSISEEIQKLALVKLAEQRNLFEAELFWEEITTQLPWVKKTQQNGQPVPLPSWNGIQLRGTIIGIKKETDKGIQFRHYAFVQGKRSGVTRLHATNTPRITLARKCVLYWNDLDKTRGMPARIEALLASSNNINSVYLIDFADAKTRHHWMTQLRLKKLGIKPASSLPETTRKQTAKSNTTKKLTIDCWIYEANYRAGYYSRHTDNGWKPITVDKNSNGVYIESINKSAGDMQAGNYDLSIRRIESLIRLCKLKELYLIPRRLTTTLDSGWVRFDNIFEPELEKLFAKAPSNRIYLARLAESKLSYKSWPTHIHEFITNAIKSGKLDGDSLIAQYISVSLDIQEEIREILEAEKQQEPFIRMYSPQNQQDIPFDNTELLKLERQVKTKYPFLFSDHKHITESQVFDYIKAMDNYADIGQLDVAV